MHLEEEISK